VADPLGSTRRYSGDVDEHHRQAVRAEGIRKSAGVLHDLSDRMRKRQRDNAPLQINDEQGCLWIEAGQCHGALLEALPVRNQRGD
jgi:hypothetical protein